MNPSTVIARLVRATHFFFALPNWVARIKRAMTMIIVVGLAASSPAAA